MATETRQVTVAETKERAIKPLKGYQTNCDEKNEKGKPCWGTLKMWTTAPEELTKQIPNGEVVFRCQNCWQLYHGPPHRHVHRGAAQNKGA